MRRPRIVPRLPFASARALAAGALLITAGCGASESLDGSPEASSGTSSGVSRGLSPGGSSAAEAAEAPAPRSPASGAPVEIDYPGGAVPEGLVEGRPNVLVITIDTLRADHLGLHGYPRPTSPTLDALAAESVVFDQAYAPIATTLPSHTSMFTGVYPHEHGVLANISNGRTYERDASLVTLAEVFQAAGYQTFAVVSARPLDPEFGLDAGFASYPPPPRKPRLAKDTTTIAIDAIEGQAGGSGASGSAPGFVWVHYFDPHGPYTPPFHAAKHFSIGHSMDEYLAERRFSERSQRPTGQWNDLKPGFDGYDGEVRYVDNQIERLLKSAETCGWLDGAVVAVLADHGEGLNQHDVPGHGLTWEEHLRVPMILRAPGLAPRRIPWPVSLVDFAPTLLHLVELDGEEAILAQATGVDRFRTDVRHAEARVMGQSSPRQSEDGLIEYALRADRWKLHLEFDGEVRLYDLERDPFELEDVSGTAPRVVELLSEELGAKVASQRREVRLREASPDMRAELRELGYGGR